METLNNFINEKLKISSKSNMYTCQPKDKYELRRILKERLAEDKNADLNDIDVSQITDMSHSGLPGNVGLFEGLDPHDIDISEWDVSNVTDMCSMFCKCCNFNCDLSNWDVSNVTNMAVMFSKCENFTGKGLENWNVSNVTDMDCMFIGCKKITGKELENWNISNRKSMVLMFKGCAPKNIPSWYKK